MEDKHQNILGYRKSDGRTMEYFIMETQIENAIIIYASLVTGAVALYLAEKVIMFFQKKKDPN